MITIKNFKEVLENLEFTSKGEVYTKKFESFDCLLKVDFKKKQIFYPEKKGLKINERQTCNLSSNENFVVLECVNRLLEQGYNPAHIELEPKWKVGHGASGGRADVLVRDNKGKSLLIIECKNAGTEFTKHWNETLENGSQLFGYAQQEKDASFLCLYASDFIDKKVKANYRLITLLDNKQYLEDNPKFESFKDAKVREDLYRVWKNTYQKDFTTKGLFEKDIQAYNIGKKKYSINDLSLVDSSTKQSKHHAFATILRKYNVSGRENAFDKLVNLFLCKIVDEKNNPTDLQFYWKGVAYDTPFELQDRLQKLYQTGMNEFLKEDVTYIDNQQIDKAFWAFKNDPDATRETIKDYFKQLKFFTNNDFAFIDVHNERLFYENAEVLIEIVRLFQDTKIKSNSKNQFLGDMFENFLDGGVKQSEGQFFTPMPITRFLIQSLPLENIITESLQIPKALDYACGSGHFLNELASQMRPFIEANKEVSLEEYHKEIHGIEKEYRLSKVAKVSAFMYGQDNIDITYADALTKNEKFNSNDYQILVANPPYSVKGFLSTLDQESKESYELISTIDDKQILTNNSIECFFIERAKQMLSGNGVAGIILPSPLLTKDDSTYVATRSILLKYFDIIAITEFGSGTFGKTGTNTATLFIRRKGNKPEEADHFKNRIESWFNSKDKKQKVFEDEHFIKDYCNHIEIDFVQYQSLLNSKPSDELLKNPQFKDYKNSFDELSTIKNKKKQTNFKKLSKTKQEEELNSLFISYIVKIEKEKLYYYVLASQNPTEVVIVKAPNDNKENKKFLGYDWSTAKGNEGIKLNLDAKGKHITPLYDEDNRNNPDKINHYIQQAFLGKPINIPEKLNDFVTKSPLVNMLDFSRTNFTKQISLTPKKSQHIATKWPLTKIKSCFDINKTSFNPESKPNQEFIYVDIDSVGKGTGIIEYDNKILGKDAPSRARRIAEKNDIIISSVRPYLKAFALVDKDVKDCLFSTGFFVISPKDKKLYSNQYLLNLFMEFEPLMSQIESTMGKGQYPSINKTDITNFKIPLPTIDVQKKIATECNKVEKNKEKSLQNILLAKKTIEEIIDDTFKDSSPKKIGDLCVVQSGGTPKRNVSEYWNGNINWVGSRVCQNKIISESIVEEKITELGLKNSSARLFSKETTLIALVGATIGKVAFLDFTTTTNQNIAGINPKDKSVLLPKYLFYVLLATYESNFNKDKGKFTMANLTRIKNLLIPFVAINEQKRIIKLIEKQESIIKKEKTLLESISEQKQNILKKYL